ncbi:MAG: anaerobic sulfatase maturase [Chloroflexi bacterium]|nr:anaerobic sulfatase maturase [Chloroflexota bacterium]
MQPLGVLIKPASSRCNLHCSYCFYLEKRALYPWRNAPKLTLETFDRFLEQYAAVSAPHLSFAWQGGEPTLMGLRFFEQVVERQQAAKPTGGIPWQITNVLQTNGTLLDDEWAAFFKQWRFLVGVSLDGPPERHDRFRRDWGDHSTHARVLEGIEHLNQHGVEVNILTVVSQSNVDRPRELLHYLVDHGGQWLQFIPCVETAPGHAEGDGVYTPWSITPAQYGRFLNELLDEWLTMGWRDVRIRLFDNLVQMLLGLPSESCQLAPVCGGYVVLEHNGDIYPCDFFVEPGAKLGNIHERTLTSILEDGGLSRFGALKSQLHRQCRTCQWRTLCYGECPRYRRMATGSVERSLPYFCSAYQQFFRQSLPRLQSVAGLVRRDLQTTGPRLPH